MRPTRVICDALALRHNLAQVKRCAHSQKIMAMVKANAYGCGLSFAVTELEGLVDFFGVASFDEAMAIHQQGARTPPVLLQGVFSLDELRCAALLGFHCVVHDEVQLRLILTEPLPCPIRVWVKVDTGMHRLGFLSSFVPNVMSELMNCAWVAKDIGLMTHFASADDIDNPTNIKQLQQFQALNFPGTFRSLANSAAILSMPASHADVVRPGIMLYGVSPFPNQTGAALGLLPVIQFVSKISAIHEYPKGEAIGYSATWVSQRSSRIGVVPAGYGDGYPRVIRSHTPVWVRGVQCPIVGRVSMDMLTVDLTDCEDVTEGDDVELWGKHIPIEHIAASANTIAYELLTQMTSRVRRD